MDRTPMGSQIVIEMPTTAAEKINAAKIPTPPPLGVGCAWELRKLGQSTNPSSKAQRLIIHAPKAPKIKLERKSAINVILKWRGKPKIREKQSPLSALSFGREASFDYDF